MSLTTIQACVALVAGKLATLPLYVTDTRGELGNREELPFWFEQPDPEMPREDTITQMVCSLMTDGNAFALITDRYFHDEPKSIKVLSPMEVLVRRDERTGFLEYRVNGRVEPREDIVHVRGMSYPGWDIGVGPITYGARLIGAASREAEYVARRFEDHGAGAAVPDWFIESEHAIDTEQAKAIGKAVSARAGGLSRGVLVLDNGMRARHIQFNARELELIASRKYTNVELCSMMQVPAHLVNVQTENSMTYSNVRNDMIALAAFGLENWAGRLAAGLSMRLLPRGKKLVFDLDDLFRRLWMMVGTSEVNASLQDPVPMDPNKIAGLKAELAKLQNEVE